MFKRFTRDEVSTSNQIKASIQRNIRAKVCESYPYVVESGAIDQIMPKKEAAVLLKCPDHVQVLVMDNVPLFFAQRDGPWFPTLRLLHQYPQMMKRLRADEGAIKFVLSGANIMCPGLTSPGATMHDEAGPDEPVAIYAEGKDLAMAVGLTKMSTQEMRDVNKGIGVDNMHHLNDGLWKMQKFD